MTNVKGVAAALIADSACAIAVIAEAERNAFFATIPGGAAELKERGRIEGINYSNGKPGALAFYTLVH